MARKRNKAKETAYEDTPAQVKRREARNRARAKAMRDGRVKKGDGKEVDHKSFTTKPTSPLNNAPSNVHVISRHANRIKQPKHKGKNYK